MTAVLSQRALNRATLARQLLLQRADRPVDEVVEHLVGLQAQTPHSWYVGLWSRIAGFHADQAAEMLTERRLVRVALMRSTIHLVTAADARGLRAVVQPALDRDLFARLQDQWPDVPPATLAYAVRNLLPLVQVPPRGLWGRS